jgi:hypothetical protein
MMKSQHEIRARIKELLADDRLHYRTATVFENAPLALVQLGMEMEIRALAWVLGEPMPKIVRPK